MTLQLKHRDGRSLDVAALPEALALVIAPALGSGWAFSRPKQITIDEVLGAQVAEPKVVKVRAVKPIPEPALNVRKSVEDLFLPGYSATRATVRAQLSQHGIDTIDRALDWMVQAGALVKVKKTYSAKVPA